MKIYCCGCNDYVEARETRGKEIYPHRDDLKTIPFYICDKCKNYVGTHHKDSWNNLRPLGVIPTPEIRKYRKKIHELLDPIWKKEFYSRTHVYEFISKKLGYEYHTANIKSVDEAIKVIDTIKMFK